MRPNCYLNTYIVQALSLLSTHPLLRYLGVKPSAGNTQPATAQLHLVPFDGLLLLMGLLALWVRFLEARTALLHAWGCLHEVASLLAGIGGFQRDVQTHLHGHLSLKERSQQRHIWWTCGRLANWTGTQLVSGLVSSS